MILITLKIVFIKVLITVINTDPDDAIEHCTHVANAHASHGKDGLINLSSAIVVVTMAAMEEARKLKKLPR